MKIATFNINGVRARIDTLTGWLSEARPDVVVLQEIKTQDEGFPSDPIADLGYNIETHGQKGFNGVAILSKRPIEVTRGLPGDVFDQLVSIAGAQLLDHPADQRRDQPEQTTFHLPTTMVRDQILPIASPLPMAAPQPTASRRPQTMPTRWYRWSVRPTTPRAAGFTNSMTR